MELNEAIYERRSIRAYLPDPVPREKIEKCVEIARWTPSWGNIQPWEILVVDGEKAAQLARSFETEVTRGAAPRPEVRMPVEFPEKHKTRYMSLGRSLFEQIGIEREDKEARQRHYAKMYSFFGAPAIAYFLVDSALNEPYACLDIGSIATTFCYAARQEGLGTTYLAASVCFPDIIRRVVDVPPDKKIVIGVAVGVPNPDAPANLFRSDREPVDAILRFA